MAEVVKVVLRFQYRGARAGQWASVKNGDRPTAEYMKSLLDDLQVLDVPRPMDLEPMWQSGVVDCIWHTPKGGELYKRIHRGYCRRKFLSENVEKNISWIKFDEYSTKRQVLGDQPLALRGRRRSISPRDRRRSISPRDRRCSISPGTRRTPGEVERRPRSRRPSPSRRPMSARSLQYLDETQRMLRRLSDSVSKGASVPFELESPEELRKEQDLPSDTPTRSRTESSPAPIVSSTSTDVSAQTNVSEVHPNSVGNSCSERSSRSEGLAAPAIPNVMQATSSPEPRSPEGDIHDLSNMRLDLQKQSSGLREHEIGLEQHLVEHAQPPGAEEGESVDQGIMTEPFVDKDVSALREMLERETAARQAAETELQEERRKRVDAEAILEDMRRERSAPFIVPGMADAFIKLARLTEEALSSR
ncbi:hypothetical protein POSPLADRAFT_1143230 [Postia placenta MAD-698-R-SB12]|uniref:Uncharacterized protein n=1 Tax=Postia placenta MAD-698-R-SB12 TaxID=670580 RepID=A0A1X6N0L8_9APHY|nr:hypothetical protein POSPLADRAFT_1143230 [Postia placenta MAD-698-R-SB12]OSX61993.1 hypothetical protein POSPLADRAFT_1143230 [Postia placenta MAD-698-R-SB12]